MKQTNLNIVGLGNTFKISLNLSKENNAHNNHKNRLRCTWLIIKIQFYTVLTNLMNTVIEIIFR